MFTKKEQEMIIHLISDAQIKMIVQDHAQYGSAEYIDLEKLKVKVKDMYEV